MAGITGHTTQNCSWARGVALALILATGIGWQTPEGQSQAAASDVVETQSSAAADEAPAFTAEEAEVVASLQRLYEVWGLEFPDASIRFHADSTVECKGQGGLYREWATGPATVDVCYPGDDPKIGDIMRANVLLHELGHAYIESQADEATKASFLDALGLESWTGGEWDEQGAEYAADILVWGMMTGRHRLMVPDLDCETKSAGFTILTGLAGPAC